MKTSVYCCNVRDSALLCLLALFFCAPMAFGQCAATYQDGSDDGVNVYAWSTITDNYTILYSGCAPQAWGNSFTHSDTAEVTITSPSFRQSSLSVTHDQCAGCGAGYSRADASLAIGGEYDSFSIGAYQDIICTVAGAFFSRGTTFSLTPSQHTYPGQPWPNCRVSQTFDRITGRGRRHRAQDVRSTNSPDVQWGQQVQAVEGGTIIAVVTAQPAASWPACRTTSPVPQPNSVKVQADPPDSSVTYYGHVTIAAGLKVGDRVTQGQVIGTLDNSGCQSAPHTHMARRRGGPIGPIVNFTLPCVNSQLDSLGDCCDEEEDP